MVNDEFHKLFSYTFWLYVPIQPPGHITENANRVAPRSTFKMTTKCARAD